MKTNSKGRLPSFTNLYCTKGQRRSPNAQRDVNERRQKRQSDNCKLRAARTFQRSFYAEPFRSTSSTSVLGVHIVLFAKVLLLPSHFHAAETLSQHWELSIVIVLVHICRSSKIFSILISRFLSRPANNRHKKWFPACRSTSCSLNLASSEGPLNGLWIFPANIVPA